MTDKEKKPSRKPLTSPSPTEKKSSLEEFARLSVIIIKSVCSLWSCALPQQLQ